jgi:hypothetical protein
MIEKYNNGFHRTLCLLLTDRCSQVLWNDFSGAHIGLLFSIAKEEGVAPSLYHSLARHGADLPPPVTDHLPALQAEYYQSVARNASYLFELSGILAEFSRAGIPVIVLKGAAIALTLYPDPGLRSMNDIDLIVRRSDFESAYSIMAARGYEPVAQKAPWLNREIGTHVGLASKHGAKILVDLHWSLLSGSGAAPAPTPEWLWGNVEPLKPLADGALLPSARTLTPEAQLLYYSAHLVLLHGYAGSRLLWFYDIYRLLVLWGDRLNWEKVIHDATLLHWSAVLLSLSAELQALFGVQLPAQVLQSLALSTERHTEIYIQNRAIHDQTSTKKLLRKLALHHPGIQLKIILAAIFPTPAYMKEKYGSKFGAFWYLLYPYRWLLALKDVLKTLALEAKERK